MLHYARHNTETTLQDKSLTTHVMLHGARLLLLMWTFSLFTQHRTLGASHAAVDVFTFKSLESLVLLFQLLMAFV